MFIFSSFMNIKSTVMKPKYKKNEGSRAKRGCPALKAVSIHVKCLKQREINGMNIKLNQAQF